MDFHLDRAEQKLQQQRKKEAAQRKREAAQRAAAKVKAERESAKRAEMLAPALEAQRLQLEELQRQREAAERTRADGAVVKGAGRKMHRAATPQLCFRGSPPPADRLDREKILREEPGIAATVAAVDPAGLAELLLARFGAKGGSASSRNVSARQERCRVCNALRLSMMARSDTAYAFGLATIDQLASRPPLLTPACVDQPTCDGNSNGEQAQTRNPTLPMCLLLDSLMATGIVLASSDTELAEGFVLGALQRPGWFAAARLDAPRCSQDLEPEQQPHVQPRELPTCSISPRVLIQLMRIYAVRATSIPLDTRSAFALGLLRSKTGNLKDVSWLVEAFELPFDPPYILTDLCECQRWHVAVRYACGVGKRGGAAAASWAAKWGSALDVLITALAHGPVCAIDTSSTDTLPATAAETSQKDVLGGLVSAIEYGQRLDLLRQLALEGGARCATLPVQVKLVEALRQNGAASLLAAAAAERMGDRCVAECFALNRQLLAAGALLAAPMDPCGSIRVAATPTSIDFISKGCSSADVLASAIAGLQTATVVAIDAEWPASWTEKQARLSGEKPLAALLQLAIVGGISDGHVIIVDLLPDLALSEICVATLGMLADDTILKLGFSLSNDLRRVVPALRAALAGETEPATTPPSTPAPQPEPEDAIHTSDDSESDGSASDESHCGGVADNGDETVEAEHESWYQSGELSEAGMLGPEAVASELDRMGCLDGDIPAIDQLFNPKATGSASRYSSRQVKTILLLCTPAPDGPAVPAAAPSVVACVLGQERRLQLGRCASALGCPRSSLSLIPASKLVSICGFPRGAIGPVGLRSNSVGQPPRVLIDEELMPAVLPAFSPDAATTSAGSSNAQLILSSDLEAATILCGAGRSDLVFRVRPRQLLQALGDRGSAALIHAEGAPQADETTLSFQPMGRRARRKERESTADTRTEYVVARHALDLQAAVGQMLPLRATDGKQRTYSSHYTQNA